jgi:addiction module RelE/StbE family toxin
MKVIWMPEAQFDLLAIRRYIAKDNEEAASAVVGGVVKFVELQLATFPKSGKAGRLPGTYEIVVPKLPYFIPYRLRGEDTIEILRVYHTSRL